MGKMQKPLIFSGGCNFRKGKYLAFCRVSNSQCGGQGFESPSAPPIVSSYFRQNARPAVFHFQRFWRQVEMEDKTLRVSPGRCASVPASRASISLLSGYRYDPRSLPRSQALHGGIEATDRPTDIFLSHDEFVGGSGVPRGQPVCGVGTGGVIR